MNEFDTEPVPGLPEELPEGEQILWQGKPGAWGIARRVLLVPYVAIYFGVLTLWTLVGALNEGAGLAGALVSALWLVGLAAAAMAILGSLAWMIHRTTVYTITNRRIVFRYGLALPMALNIPFNQVVAAAVNTQADQSGDLALSISEDHALAYIFMWPHAQPWSFKRPKPMLRSIAGIATVSTLLGRALAATSASEVARRAIQPQTQAGRGWRRSLSDQPDIA